MNTVQDYLSERRNNLKKLSRKEKHKRDIHNEQSYYTYSADAFGHDIGAYEKSFMLRIWKRVQNWEITEEISQDVMADMMKLHSQNKIASVDDLYRLMNHVARCKCINYLKKKSTHIEELTDSTEMDYFPLPESYAPEEDMMRIVLYEHIAHLKEIEQKVVRGKINEIPLEILAEDLGRTPHAVECIYSRAVKKLKKMIQGKDWWN